MNTLWPSRTASDPPAPAPGPAGDKPVDEDEIMADAGVADMGLPEAPTAPTPNPPEAAPSPSRPQLLRNTASQPPPPAAPQPPPTQISAPPAAGSGNNNNNINNNNNNIAVPQQPQDSLSLAQLRRIVAEFPRSEPVAYDFAYEDQAPLDEEVDEWFVYQFWQWVRLNSAQKAFDRQWADHMGGADVPWADADPDARERLISDALAKIQAADLKDGFVAVDVILYLVLGRWADTAAGAASAAAPDGKDGKRKSAATQGQLDAIKSGVMLVAKLGGVPIIWEALRNAFEAFWSENMQQMPPNSLQEAQDELTNLMTIMYIMIQETLADPLEMASVYTKLLDLNPNIAVFMMNATAKLRWDDAGSIPQGQVFLLFWKSLLLVFGGIKEIDETKEATRELTEDGKAKDTITASPLDYHVFRQEITSKYPAYIPPQPVIPLEAEQTSLLPPLPNHPTRNNGSNGIIPGPPNPQAGGASILHQPVHIATPAPSPPPSPGVGGKGGKKQNYQTNQNFPFMYPPLDATSNSAGGKGLAGLQDALVGRKWEGSDVPASILEAGEIFSTRVRMTRATRQLWEERERFLRFERGWDAEDDDIIDELDLSSLTLSEKEELGLIKQKDAQKPEKIPDYEVDYGPRQDVGDRVKQRLELLETFYSESLPQLQSLVIVLLKALLLNVAVAMSQLPPNQQHPGVAGQGPRPNGQGGMNGANPSANGDGGESSPEEIDTARTREISTKAVSGIMLLLLKWLKVSHVLKFEYLTQLLLDCNYVPLLLKLWAHQDVQQLVDSKTDRIENSFFYLCNIAAGAPERAQQEAEPEASPEAAEQGEESEDDAAPPPIKRRRSPPGTQFQEGGGGGQGLRPEDGSGGGGSSSSSTRPEVDELGYPVNALPVEPITDFSRRNFFSLINLLRVMQKVCKNKAHRNLLLVHYKSSNILRKMLKVPQPELRLYTLKLFKNQVPYCGRKWRQGNMRVITAVYLHCRPELRDEWLAGSDVDAEVEEALPLEQALRSLTHWFNVRRYPDKMAAEVRAALREEQDFFMRELERLNWGDVADGESVMSDWEGMPHWKE